MAIKTINKIEREFGKMAIPRDIADKIIYRMGFKELENMDKVIICRLIRDNDVQKLVDRRNRVFDEKRSEKIKEIKAGLEKNRKGKRGSYNQKCSTCEFCGKVELPVSVRVHSPKATINRISGASYCSNCDVIHREKKVEEVKEEPKKIEVDYFEKCTPRTEKIIRMLVDEFGFSPMGFDVNVSEELQRAGHQTIYYMGKKLTNNRLSRLMENKS